MDIKIIKELSQKYSQDDLIRFADELENTEKTSCPECQNNSDINEVMSNFLQACEIKKLIDNGVSLNEAIREFTKRVRTVLS
ncbi:DUF6952 family protein [Fluviispira sanaruensis]|uniref:Uncharacterized protein n=1 Tax=Fluviispira sanaruensis TaxID=2493639 RepID=A0A4V0P264_FLUSA|nr:hypothetical protein [Fluviispira sanaruensis]BBH52137.1 hypothetical protein JCM31447_05760 [Fluviispira sanaruensis]